ncbi:MAG: nitroreductase [Proteobacteria bacterium]|nr:nitroreductase [Pseudomonadota bacterium]
MNLTDAIYHRRAIRDYTSAPVEREAIDGVIRAAIQAPSSMNRQPWSFTIVADRDLLKYCSDRAKALVLAAAAGNAHLADHRDALASPTSNIFYNAPILIVISAMAADPMAEQDCCLAAQNLMLDAYARGLGTCWIGFAEAWLGETEGKAALRIPPEHKPVAPIIIGHPSGEHPAPARTEPHVTWIGS